MTDNVIVTHTKHDNIADWTQVTVDAQIAAGNLPPGTLLADLVLPSDWNADHTIAGMTQLISNVRNYVVVDMGNADYTMTDAEAVTNSKIVINSGDGTKTLTWPTTADSYIGTSQTVSMGFASAKITLACQTGGSPVVIQAGVTSEIGCIPGVSVVLLSDFYSLAARGGTNGVNAQSADYTAIASDAGKLIVFTAGSTLTIDEAATTDYGPNAVIRVLNLKGSGAAVNILSGGGVTIYGSATTYDKCITELQRDHDTDKWYVSAVNNEFIKTINGAGLGSDVYPVWVSGTGTEYAQVDTALLSYKPSTGIMTTNGHRLADTTVASSAAAGLTLFSFDQQGFSVPHYTDDTGAQIELCRDNVIVCKNTSGGTVNKGQTVYITGSTGNVANLAKAKADAAATMPCFGVMFETTTNNSFGRVMLAGVLESVDTSAYTSGDILYVSAATAGGVTATKPTSPNIVQEVGRVLVSGVGNGSIQVYQGTEVPYGAGTGDVTKVGTPVNNQVGVWTGDGTIEGDTALTFDTTTDTLSTTSLMLNGAVALNASNFFGIKENTNTYAETNIQNINAGTSASSDYVATADNGNDTTNYIDLGINSSAYTDAAYTISGVNDGYLYVNGGGLALGTQTAAKAIKFHTGGTLSANNRGGISGTGEWNNNGISLNTHKPEGNVTIPADMYLLAARYLQVASGFTLLIGAGATLEIT